ncbi:serine hydrolase domain-containing protein [Glycomyces halotolerans]
MRKYLIIAAAMALSLTAVPAAAHAQAPDPALDEELLDGKLEAFYETGDHSVLAEVRVGDEVWADAEGPRGLHRHRSPVDEDDRVRIASLTKSMVATVLLQLEAEGEIDLDDALSDHLPGLLPYEREPTVRQIMRHTGGLADYFPYLYASLSEGDMSDVYENYRNYYSPEELVAIGTQDPLLFEPGTDWSYSNTGYIALGMLIEELSGERLRDVLEERVFDPVGMRDTYLPRGHGWGIRGPNPVPYSTTGDERWPYFDTSRLSHSQMWAAGGVISTMEDVNDFYDALLEGELLGAEQLDAATDWYDTGVGYEYGLGLTGLRMTCPGDAEQVYIGHTGGGMGHQTYSFHSPGGDRQVTVTWNIDYRHPVVDPAELNAALSAFLVAGLCGVDADAGPRTLRAPELPDFPSLMDPR